MARNPPPHPEGDDPEPRVFAFPTMRNVPMDNRDLAKHELARKLARLLTERDMNQSDLARAAGLPRELISTYIRGRSFPTPLSLSRMAKGLGFKDSNDLLPESMALQVRDEHPALDMRQLSGHSDKVWLRINQAVSLETAAKIMQLLTEASRASTAKDSPE